MLLSFLKIAGHSMEPHIKNGSVVIISFFSYLFKDPKIGDIVAFRKDLSAGSQEKNIYVKRIRKIKGHNYFVSGDNKADSIGIGWVRKRDIVGKMVYKI